MKKLFTIFVFLVTNTAFAQTFTVNNLAVNGSLSLANPISTVQGGTGAASPTGYVKFNGLSAPTFSPTIPISDISNTLPSVLNNAALQSTPITAFPVVVRDSFAALGDSPPISYGASNAPCSLNGGNGDNGSQVKSSDSKCWIALFPGYIDPTWFGASTASGDNQFVVQNALLAAARLGVTKIIFPPGKFTFLSPISYTLPASGIGSINISGAGLDNTILFFSSGTGGLTITFPTALVSAHVRDLSITTGNSGPGTGLTFTASAPVADPASTPGSTVTNVSIRGDDAYSGNTYVKWWGTGMLIQGVTYVQLYNFNAFGPSTHAGDGLVIQGFGTSYAAGVAITSSNFVALGHGIVYGSYVQGVTVFQSSFPGDTIGIIAKTGLTGILDGLLVTGCEFATTSAGIITQTAIGNVQIYGNAFQNLNASGTNVSLNPNNVFTIFGNIFETSSSVGTTGLVIGPTGGNGIITGNQFSGFATAVTLTAGSSNTNVQSNTYLGNAANVTNSGAGNTVGGGSP